MNELAEIAPAFVEMAHRIVWATVASVDVRGRPRSRILHPIWQWDGERLTGWIGTSPTVIKRTHLENNPFLSVNYWTTTHDTCAAECRAELVFDDAARTMVWELFTNAPPPVGYNPGIVPAWKSPTSDTFAVLRLSPWRLRVFPGTVLLGKGGHVLNWRE